MKKRYAIHPCYYMDSKYDKQVHYISYSDLIRSYKLDPKDCILWDSFNENTYRGRKEEDYIHLYADYYGNYKIN